MYQRKGFTMKKTDYTLLGKLIKELYNENNKVFVETTFALDDHSHYNPITFDEHGKIQGTSAHYPTKSGNKLPFGPGMSLNSFYATSFRVGQYTFRQLVVPVHGQKAYDIKFLVRGSENEEATYDYSDRECNNVWVATEHACDAGRPGTKQYEHSRNIMRQYLLSTLRDESLRQIASQDFVKFKQDHMTIYDKATKKLKSLGVETDETKMHRTLLKIKQNNKNKQ